MSAGGEEARARRVPVETSQGAYEVTIGRGLTARLGAMIRERFGAPRIGVISDSTVASLYRETLSASLAEAGLDVRFFDFPAGESRKTFETVGAALDFLARERFTRSDFVLAFGGGVPGDLAGFAAAIYLRGVRFLQVPTTLLAAVDSSVGGKTGVDLPQGKNLAGAFWQPSAVYCDPDFFRTLPDERVAEGYAEMIKHGLIADEAYLRRLETLGPGDGIEEIIARSVEIKASFVAVDTRDTGLRQTLNFGHTFGHAIEKVSAYSVSHGSAVAIGMMMACRAADRLGLSESSMTARLEALLRLYRLPTGTAYGAEELAGAALSDKKRSGETIQFVFPIRAGAAALVPVPAADIPRVFRLGLS